MDPVTVLSLLISSGLLTELVKFGFKVAGKPIPRNLVPLLSSGFAAGLASGPAVGLPDLGIPPEIAAALGLSTTGLHQVMNAHKYNRKEQPPQSSGSGTGITAVAPYLWPLMLSLGACSVLPAFLQLKQGVPTEESCRAVLELAKANGAVRETVQALGPEAAALYQDVALLLAERSQGCEGFLK